ncbi:MAG: CoA pyrophosphatase [Hydrocarboniphaga effusa]|nr:CoA pyrophosphatase [Hydrocarboniphaga effusa]
MRKALAGTTETAPRPISQIELPFKLEKLLTPRILKTLRPASVLVPVIRRAAGLNVLLTRRSEAMRSHKGQISFPGGRREDSDGSAAAAALREAEEEVGLPPLAVEVVGYLDDYPTVTGYRVTPVVGIVAEMVEARPCAREVAEVFEVPLPFLLDLRNFERKVFSGGDMDVPYFEVNHGSYRIWGATAGMLFNLAKKVADHE